MAGNEREYDRGFDDAICLVRELLLNRISGTTDEGEDGEIWIVRQLLDGVNAISDQQATRS